MLLKLIPDNTNINFMRWKYVTLTFSVLLIIASIALVAVRGLNFGIDFKGGILIEAGFSQQPDLDDLRGDLNGLGLGAVSLQEFGSDRQIAIRLQQQEGGEEGQQVAVTKVREALTAKYGEDGVSFRRIETVGGKVSNDLIWDASLAIGLAMLGIAIYIWFRFEWQFGVGGLVSLFHDVVLVMGFVALLGLEFDLNMVAALLTTVGYSLNDTVVIYDRIRENLRKYRKMDMEPLLNLSINETLSRTIMVSLATSVALLALLIFGGEVLRGFTAAMLVGVWVGTFSSVYVASPLLIFMKVGPHTFLQSEEHKASKAEKAGKGEQLMAKLEAIPARQGALSIQGYTSGGYRVGGTLHQGGVILTPERMATWPVTDLTAASVEDFTLVTTQEPSIEVLLLGTGPNMARPPVALIEALKATGLAVDFMDSRAAARTYNVLVAENRRVAAALLPLD